MIESIIETLRSIGDLGVLLIAILDSSFLSIPEINDIIVVVNVAHQPDQVFYWPFLTTTGSVIGCYLLYSIARKGGQTLLHRWFSARRLGMIERLFAQYGALAIIIPALCPPPTPFKVFVATAGALQFPAKRFLVTVLLARSVRYFGEGILAYFYGWRVEAFIKQHALFVAGLIILVVTLSFLVIRLVENRLGKKKAKSAPAKSKVAA